VTLTSSKLNLIPASALVGCGPEVPDGPGVYMFFICKGLRLLSATSYFDTDDHLPPTAGEHVLLYIGAARTSVRDRLNAHFSAMREHRSSLRLTLFAIEHARRAISQSRTPFCQVLGPRSLSEWLLANSKLGIIPCHEPFELERRLIEELGSPFNINWRLQHVYSKLLMEWREAVLIKANSRKVHNSYSWSCTDLVEKEVHGDVYHHSC
jgi:hypothetical protein